jgi:hypothetical protein
LLINVRRKMHIAAKEYVIFSSQFPHDSSKTSSTSP